MNTATKAIIKAMNDPKSNHWHRIPLGAGYFLNYYHNDDHYCSTYPHLLYLSYNKRNLAVVRGPADQDVEIGDLKNTDSTAELLGFVEGFTVEQAAMLHSEVVKKGRYANGQPV